MARIENLIKEYVAAYNLGDKEKYTNLAKSLIREINHDEAQFGYLTHNYIAAKALYYLCLQKERPLTPKECAVVVKLEYLCLLNNFVKNKEVDSLDIKYLDVIGGSELAVIVLCENVQYLISVLVGEVGYLPNYAQKHLRDQLMLFGGIVKDANEKNIGHMLEDKLSKKFNDLYKELYQQFPTGKYLQSFKDGCTPIMKDILSYLRMGLKEPDYEF